MTTTITVAQVAANADPSVARALHLISLFRGRLDALEVAIAGRDARAADRILLQADDLFNELQLLTLQDAA